MWNSRASVVCNTYAWEQQERKKYDCKLRVYMERRKVGTKRNPKGFTQNKDQGLCLPSEQLHPDELMKYVANLT